MIPSVGGGSYAMGRETVAHAEWQGQTAEVKAIAEANEVILRGAIKARIPRDAITGLCLEKGLLTIDLGAEQLRLDLGATEAEKWLTLLRTSPPSLAAKLGISPEKPAFLLGETDDPALTEALAGARTGDPASASVVISVISADQDLSHTLNFSFRNPDKAIWCVYRKGKAANPGDATIREAMRNAGFRDNKSCSVSERLTATRYALPVNPIRPEQR